MQKNLVAFILMFGSFVQAGTYTISFKNISNRQGFGGQPITPAAIVIHKPQFKLFTENRPSSREVWLIAEDGATARALSLPQRDSRALMTAKGPRILPGLKQSIQITIPNRFDKEQLSFVSMLSRTNDGFTGLQNIRLPQKINDVVIRESLAWDAGSELNTETCGFVPCAFHMVRMPQGAEGAVRLHSGIQGNNDLSKISDGWPADNKIGLITIRRDR